VTEADRLNADCRSGTLDQAALQDAFSAQGEEWADLLRTRCPHILAGFAVFISQAQLRSMYDAIYAVENVTGLAGWCALRDKSPPSAKGVLYGYDFHINQHGVYLIEINTNAGGAFINELLIESQRTANIPGQAAAIDHLAGSFVAMFRNEWRLERGSAPFRTIAIIDDQPEGQYLYPEFILAKRMLERDGLSVHVVDPSQVRSREDGLYAGDEKIDLVYNRLTDFSLQQHPQLLESYATGAVVLTPSPAHFSRYAEKRNLAKLADEHGLRAIGANEADIAVLREHVPYTAIVHLDAEERFWAERRQWFFKPIGGYGSKGAYRGGGLTKRVFSDIVHGNYIAQKIAPPGERAICLGDGEASNFKYDVRCFVYDRQIQLVAARLYQGQTTNFRTPGGGFALVRVVE
jgi:hypothetical protein